MAFALKARSLSFVALSLHLNLWIGIVSFKITRKERQSEAKTKVNTKQALSNEVCWLKRSPAPTSG